MRRDAALSNKPKSKQSKKRSRKAAKRWKSDSSIRIPEADENNYDLVVVLFPAPKPKKR